MNKTLDGIFETYDRRKQTELDTAQDGAAKAKAEVEQGLSALKDLVLPALRVLEGAIASKGHKAKLTEKLGESYPSVILEFTPEQRTKGPPFHVPSRIAFTFYGGALETKPEIALSPPQAGAKVKLGEVTAEWVTQQVLAMVGAALDKA